MDIRSTTTHSITTPNVLRFTNATTLPISMTNRHIPLERRQGGPSGAVLELTRKGPDGFYDVIYTVDVQAGTPPRTFPMLVDTGSSDMWIAATSCSGCRAAPALYDAASSSSTIPTGQDFEYNYLVGTASGPIIWDQVSLGSYTIERQAFASVTAATNEAFELGFSGILGLALPPISRILTLLPAGSGGGNQDGATLASNLFGLPTAQAPREPFFAISLSRFDFEKGSASKNAWPARLGIGAHVDEVVHHFASEDAFNKAIRWTDLTATGSGYAHWKARLTDITVYNDGLVQQVGLPRSGDSGLYPVAVLDTGGSTMLASKRICDAIYGSWGVSISEDGKYYVPCNKPLNLTITLGTEGVPIPLHPLDMSSYINNDRNSNPTTCLGSLQANALLGNMNSPGDIVLGIPFLRNVYAIHSLATTSQATPPTGVNTDGSTSMPRLGLIPLTDINLAITEFENVRLHNLAPDGTRNSLVTDPDSARRSMGMLGKIMLGLGVFVAVCVVLFGARWFVLDRRFKQRRRAGEPSEEGMPMSERARSIVRRVTRRDRDEAVSEFGVPENIEGQAATRSAFGHGNLTRENTVISAKRQSTGPFAGFSFLTFIGARRLGFGGGYQRTANPAHEQSDMPTEDEIRQQKYEEYQQKKLERLEWAKRNRNNDTSVWSDMTWVDRGDGTFTPTAAPGRPPATPNETVFGSTTNLNAYGYTKDVDDFGAYNDGGRDHSDNGSTEKGSTLHGSPPFDKNAAGFRQSHAGSLGGRASQERLSFLPPGGQPGSSSPMHMTHHSVPSLDLNRPPRADSGTVTASPYPMTPADANADSQASGSLGSFNPYNVPVSVSAPSPPAHPIRGRFTLAMEPSLSPLTEINSSEFPPSISNEVVKDATKRASLLGTAPVVGPPPSQSDEAQRQRLRDSLERQDSLKSLGSMSDSSDVLVPLPISLMKLTSVYDSSTISTPPRHVIRMSDSPPPDDEVQQSPPRHAPVPHPPPMQHSPPREMDTTLTPAHPIRPPIERTYHSSPGAVPGPSRDPYDLLSLDPLGGANSRFPTFDSLGMRDSRFPVFAPSSSKATPRPANPRSFSASPSRPSSSALDGVARPRPRGTDPLPARPHSEMPSQTFQVPTMPAAMQEHRPRTGSHGSSNLARMAPITANIESPLAEPSTSIRDFEPPHVPRPVAHQTLPVNPPSRPDLGPQRKTEPTYHSMGVKSRGPRPLVRGSASSTHSPPHIGSEAASSHSSRQTTGDVRYDSPASYGSQPSPGGSLPPGAMPPQVPGSRSSQERSSSQTRQE